MLNKVRFREEQLFWLEELDQDLYVDILIQPKGQGIPEKGESILRQMQQLKDIPRLKREYESCNIWRSWCIYYDAEKKDEVGLVPLIFDFDNKEGDLHHVHDVTASSIDILLDKPNLTEVNLKVVFSGRKGFHIEVRPPETIDDANDWRKILLDGVPGKLGHKTGYGGYICDGIATVLDTFSPKHKPWLRITGTFYSWKSDEGKLIIRRIF